MFFAPLFLASEGDSVEGALTGLAVMLAAMGFALPLVFVTVMFALVGALMVYMIIVTWKIFVKAGEDGWKSIIPVYSGYVLFKIIYGEGWKYFLAFVPGLGVVIEAAAFLRLAYAFGKDSTFAVLSIFFSPVTMSILAFGKAEYFGPQKVEFI